MLNRLVILLLFVAAPATAQTISCVDKATSTITYSGGGPPRDIPGRVMECTHKPSGRIFYQKAGSGTPDRAPWEAAAAGKAPQPATGPAGASPARSAKSGAGTGRVAAALASHLGCRGNGRGLRSAVQKLGPYAGGIAWMPRPVGDRVHDLDPAGVRFLGWQIDALVHTQTETEEDEDPSGDFVSFDASFDDLYFAIPMPIESVAKAVSQQFGKPCTLRQGSARSCVAMPGPNTARMLVVQEIGPGRTRVQCQWMEIHE